MADYNTNAYGRIVPFRKSYSPDLSITLAALDTSPGSLSQQMQKLEASLQRQLGRGGFLEETNKRALAKVQQLAYDNLQESIERHGRPQGSRTTELLPEAIHDMKYSDASATGFRFFIRNRIFEDVPYYASIEYGDYSQVGREIKFNILGADGEPAGFSRRAAGDDYEADYGSYTRHRLVGPRERQRTGIGKKGINKARIKRPVPAYRYGTKAADEFFDSRSYQTLVKEVSAAWRNEFNLGMTTS